MKNNNRDNYEGTVNRMQRENQTSLDDNWINLVNNKGKFTGVRKKKTALRGE